MLQRENRQKRSFVFFEWAQFSPTWSHLRQRPQQLARAFARRGIPVYFVEPPSLTGVNTLSISTFEDNIFRVEAWHDTPETTASCLRSLGELLPDAAWLIHYPRWTPLLREYLSAERTVIYDCMDWWSEFPGTEWAISLWENELAVKADLVLASAMSLYTRMKLLNPSSVYLANAVYTGDYAHVLPEADDLKGIPGPRLLFVGSIEEWVDLDLVRFVAESRPEWSIVMVGPSSIPSNRLPSLPNLYWLGKRPYVELSAYMHHCDVGLIPFKQTRLTRAVNPLKVHEYVACGLPVVSTFLPDLLLFEDPAVKVTSTYDGYLEALDRTLQQRPRPRGASGAQSGTWDEKAAQFLSRLDGIGTDDEIAVEERYASALSAVVEEMNSADVAEELALAHYVRGHYEKALDFAPPRSSLRQAALVRLERHDELLLELGAHASAATSSSFSDIDAWPKEVLTAHVLCSNGEPVAALEALNSASVIGPYHHLMFGRVYAALGLFPEAVTAFSEVINVQPALLEATDFLTIGDACRELGIDEKAEDFYVHAYELGLTAQAEERLGQIYLGRAMSLAQSRAEE